MAVAVVQQQQISCSSFKDICANNWNQEARNRVDGSVISFGSCFFFGIVPNLLISSFLDSQNLQQLSRLDKNYYR